MSLQVWLPLNGDTNNYGLDNTISFASNSGATLVNTGKIGSCYSFDGTDDWMQWNINKDRYGLRPLTLSCWFKCDETKSSGCIIDIGADLCLSYAFSSGTIKFSYWRVYGTSSRVGDTNTISASFPSNTWHHVTYICDELVNKIYVDGVFVQEWASKSLAYWQPMLGTAYMKLSVGKSAGSTSWIGGQVNDVRIYDHALSDKEIEELSKGLILHYKMTEQTTLAKADLSTWTKESGVTTANQSDGSLKIDCTAKTSSRWGIYCDIQNCLPNTTYTFQVDCKVANSSKPFQLSVGCNPVPSGTSQFGTNRQTMNDTTNFITYTATVTTNSDTTWIRFYLATTCNSTNTDQQYAFVKNVRMMMGTSIDNTVYDSSGYLHNGTFLSTPLNSSDTARYSSSLNFDGIDDGILIENLVLSPIINDKITYSFWIKPNGEAGARSVYFGSYSGTSWSIEKTTGNVIRSYWNGSLDTTCSGTTINDGSWQHICLVKNGTADLKVYINGVQKFSSTASLSAKTFPTTYRIGRDTRSGDGTPYKGNMSDFRIYATALTPEQVLDLYSTSSTIDNLANVYARELVEK